MIFEQHQELIDLIGKPARSVRQPGFKSPTVPKMMREGQAALETKLCRFNKPPESRR